MYEQQGECPYWLDYLPWEATQCDFPEWWNEDTCPTIINVMGNLACATT